MNPLSTECPKCQRGYYINISAPLIVNQIKALIARDIVGMDGYFEIINSTDPVVTEAIHQIETGGCRSGTPAARLSMV